MEALYPWLKLLHVIGAVVWVGGVITLTILTARMVRARDFAALMGFARHAAFLGSVPSRPRPAAQAHVQAKGRRLPPCGKRPWQLAGDGGRLTTPNQHAAGEPVGKGARRSQ